MLNKIITRFENGDAREEEEYLDEHLRTKRKFYENGNPEFVEEYDDNGIITSTNTFFTNRALRERTKYSRGVLSNRTTFDKDGVKQEYTEYNDGTGYVTSYFDQGNKRYSIAYDEHDNVLEEITYNEDGSRYIYKRGDGGYHPEEWTELDSEGRIVLTTKLGTYGDIKNVPIKFNPNCIGSLYESTEIEYCFKIVKDYQDKVHKKQDYVSFHESVMKYDKTNNHLIVTTPTSRKTYDENGKLIEETINRSTIRFHNNGKKVITTSISEDSETFQVKVTLVDGKVHGEDAYVEMRKHKKTYYNFEHGVLVGGTDEDMENPFTLSVTSCGIVTKEYQNNCIGCQLM